MSQNWKHIQDTFQMDIKLSWLMTLLLHAYLYTAIFHLNLFVVFSPNLITQQSITTRLLKQCLHQFTSCSKVAKQSQLFSVLETPPKYETPPEIL